MAVSAACIAAVAGSGVVVSVAAAGAGVSATCCAAAAAATTAGCGYCAVFFLIVVVPVQHHLFLLYSLQLALIDRLHSRDRPASRLVALALAEGVAAVETALRLPVSTVDFSVPVAASDLK